MTILSPAQMAGYLKAAGFPADQIGIGVAVGMAESGGDTSALNTKNSNGSWDAGFMQVNSVHGYTQTYLFDPSNNAKAAFGIFKAAGNKWTPWSTYNSGRYRVFLAQGNKAAGNPAATTASTSPDSPASNGSPGTASLDRLAMGGLWLRIGAFLLGTILMGLGAMVLLGSSKTVQGAASSAVKIAIARRL
jgi:hypothetical protein